MIRHRRESLTFGKRHAALAVVGAALAALSIPAPAPAAVEVVAAQVKSRALTVARSVTVTPATVVTPQRVPPIVGERGLTDRALTLAHYIQAAYPGVLSIGGVRPCDRYGEHCRGVALDVMVGRDSALGDAIAADVLSRQGVRFVIWRETLRRPNGTRAWMADRGSATANHFDHAHIAVTA